MKHVSIDIEACGEVLLSVGAVVFDPLTGGMPTVSSIKDSGGMEFYGVLSAQPQMDRGLKMDGGAFEWWLKQSQQARDSLASPRDPEVVLSELHSFMARVGDCWLWAYPTSFDLPVIERVCKTFGLRSPWKWTRTMDGRTLWRLACSLDPECAKVEKDGPAAHNALEDARQQARWFARYLTPVLRGASLAESSR